MGIFVSNWNGKSIHFTGIRKEIISRVVLKENRIFYSYLQNNKWHIELFDLSSKTSREIIKSNALLQLGDVIGDSQIIYIRNDGEISEIKIADLSGKSKTITSSRWVESSPRWHSFRIFFVSNRGGSPHIYETREGGGARRLTYQGNYNTEPAISLDGSKMAFSSLSGGFQIYILDFTSGQQTQITKEGNNEQPSFCPDGNFLTIMSDRRGRKEIYLISSDGFVQKPLTVGFLPYCTR
jgi:TolB protein